MVIMDTPQPYELEQRVFSSEKRCRESLSKHNFKQIDQMRLEFMAGNDKNQHRIATILNMFTSISHLIDFKLDQASRQDLLHLVKNINQDNIGDIDHSIWTLCEYKQAVKEYYKWKNDEEHPDILDFMSVHPSEKQKPKVDRDELLTVRMAEEMINACENPRDMAFMGMLWDSGARISEILTLRWKDLVFQDNMIRVNIWNAKTRPRKLYLVECKPLIERWRDWKKQYTSLEPQMPVFTNYRPYDSSSVLSYRNARKQMAEVQEDTGIPERVRTNPHAWRKARATDLAGKGMTQPNMNLHFGWCPGSSASRYYIELANRDLERQMRELYPGLEPLPENGPKYIGENIPVYSESDRTAYREASA